MLFFWNYRNNICIRDNSVLFRVESATSRISNPITFFFHSLKMKNIAFPQKKINDSKNKNHRNRLLNRNVFEHLPCLIVTLLLLFRFQCPLFLIASIWPSCIWALYFPTFAYISLSGVKRSSGPHIFAPSMRYGQKMYETTSKNFRKIFDAKLFLLF